MQLTSLHRLLLDEIQELYLSETLLAEAMPRMEIGADSANLKNALRKHHEQTTGHIERLETVCSLLETSPRGGRALAVKAMLHEVEDQLGEGGEAWLVDAALIAAARRIEHWEMAGYGTAQLYATALGQPKVADLLGQTLAEEQATDSLLLQMAGAVHVKEKAPAH